MPKAPEAAIPPAAPEKSNDITELRSHLFDTLRDLRNKEHPIDIDRVKAVNSIAKTVIDSAKVEVNFLRVTGGEGTGFLPDGQAAAPKLPNGATVRRHRLAG